MAEVLPTSSTEGVELVHSHAPQYWRDKSDLTIRGRIWLYLMEMYGTMEFNVDASYAGVWNIMNKLPDVVPQGDSATITFDEHNSMDQLTVDLRGYRATDRLGHKNWLINRGNQNRIVNIYDDKSENLLKAMRKMINADLYIDGYAANNTNRYIGLNSFMGYSSGNTAVTDRLAYPSDTYGGKSTELGALGGTAESGVTGAETYNANFSSHFPDETFSEEYDCLTPLLVNYTSSAWTNSTWKTNCEEVLRFAIDVQANRGAASDESNSPNLAMSGRKLFTDFKEYFSARNQIIQPVANAIDLGFPETLNFEGTWLTFDYDCPSTECYLMNPGSMEYFSPQDDLFDVFGPEWNLSAMSFLYLVSNYGNFRWQPKMFAKLAPFAAA